MAIGLFDGIDDIIKKIKKKRIIKKSYGMPDIHGKYTMYIYMTIKTIK